MKEWRPIEGFDGYFVSQNGEVLSFKHDKINGRLLSICKNRCGYNYVMLRDKNHKKNSKLVHTLVARAFIPKIVGKDYVNHIDGDKANNDVSNLEWCTLSENTQHAIKMGLLNHKKFCKSVCQCDLQGNIIKVFSSVKEASEELKLCNSSHIFDCLKGRRANCKGYKWKYLEEVKCNA